MEILSKKLNKRIVIEQVFETADGLGGRSQSWQEYAAVWAQILPRRASEDFFAGQLKNAITHKIIIRYLAGLSEKMRVNYGGRIFRIASIINVAEGNEVYEILAEEIR